MPGWRLETRLLVIGCNIHTAPRRAAETPRVARDAPPRRGPASRVARGPGPGAAAGAPTGRVLAGERKFFTLALNGRYGTHPKTPTYNEPAHRTRTQKHIATKYCTTVLSTKYVVLLHSSSSALQGRSRFEAWRVAPARLASPVCQVRGALKRNIAPRAMLPLRGCMDDA